MSECLSVATTERWIWASPLIAIQQMQPLQVVSSRCLQCEEAYVKKPSKNWGEVYIYLTGPGICGVRSLVLLESCLFVTDLLHVLTLHWCSKPIPTQMNSCINTSGVLWIPQNISVWSKVFFSTPQQICITVSVAKWSTFIQRVLL